MRGVFAFAVVAVVAGCSKPSAGVAACEESKAMASVDRLGKQKFPDNPRVAWKGTSYKTKDGLSFVEAVPTPDEVGYPKFVFVVQCKTPEPKMVGAYAWQKDGKYSLLFTADGAPSLPTSPP